MKQSVASAMHKNNSQRCISRSYTLGMSRETKTKEIIRERFSGNQAEFARAVKRSPNQIWQYLNGHRSMGEKVARHIETCLRLPAGYLDGDVERGSGKAKPRDSFTARPTPQDELKWGGPMEVWDSDSPLDEDEVELPLFREVELSAGSGRTEVIENHGAKLKFAKSSLRRAGVSAENAACAFVSGDSMARELPDGATVGVDTSEKQIRDGKLYALDHDGMLRVKQVHRLPGGGLRLVSFNDEYPDEEYTSDQVAETIRVIGRVFWSAAFW